MLVQQVMSETPIYISKDTSIKDVAKKMQELECGFLPVGDGDKLDGVVTDRDIVVRAIAKGANLQDKVGAYLSDKVLYCYEGDDVQNAIDSMERQQVYRLVVLNNDKEKQMTGIVSLGDISRQSDQTERIGAAAENIAMQAA